LLAGLPVEIPAETVNLLCASGMAAVTNAARFIQAGDGDLYIAGGVESMTRAPYVLSKSPAPFGRDAQLFDTSIGWRFVNPEMKKMYGTDSMGQTAENVAEKYKVNRNDQDLFAVRSHQKAHQATKDGRFSQEIIPVPVTLKKGENFTYQTDEFIKPGTTLEILSRLKPAFKENGSVTAGNSSGINDGSAILIVASENGLKAGNMTPSARIVASAVTGVEPRFMGIGPVTAARSVLKKAGLSFPDLDVIELNEAFAAQSLACIREWGLQDDDPRVNPNGGAIAIGHPLGMSGARLILTAVKEMELKKSKYALCTMCVGVGQGYAVILENLKK